MLTNRTKLQYNQLLDEYIYLHKYENLPFQDVSSQVAPNITSLNILITNQLHKTIQFLTVPLAVMYNQNLKQPSTNDASKTK